jgi:hypothetical protein
MSVGNLKDNGNKGNNFPYQLSVLELLGQIVDNGGGGGGGGGCCPTAATEATLLSVLNSLQNGQAFDATLVLDNASITWLEVRVWNSGTSSFDPPVYYLPGSVVPGTPAAPLSYINPNTLLAIIANTLSGILNNSTSKINRIKGATLYSRVLTYHPTATQNVLTITHSGTTPLGAETIVETFGYANAAINGSNVTSIQYS